VWALCDRVGAEGRVREVGAIDIIIRILSSDIDSCAERGGPGELGGEALEIGVWPLAAHPRSSG
jgi:hypothetical protein